MTRRRLSVALVVLVLLGTPWADAAAQTTEQVASASDAASNEGSQKADTSKQSAKKTASKKKR